MLPSIRSLWHLWFGLRTPVHQRAYVTTGLALGFLKLVGDLSIVRLAGREIWSPAPLLTPLFETRFGGLPPGLMLALALWSLPFVWIGASMTLRRLVDAGLSPTWTVFFFLPFLNYLLIALLAIRPSAGIDPATEPRGLASGPLIAVAAGFGTGLVMIAASMIVVASHSAYSWPLFVGTPFVAGFTTGYLAPPGSRSGSLVQLTLLALGGALLLQGLEGVLCLAMTWPLAAVIAWLGGFLGSEVARGSGRTTPQALSIVALGPLLALTFPATPASMRNVVTEVMIAAPPEVVWQHVVSFSELPPPTSWWFRRGIAYPVRARIEGSGVGAIRHCEFSTGAFVEPITHWDAPRRLAFDVTAQPPTMEEWSPYERLEPAHVTESLTVDRGEFRLTPTADGGTLLQGTTWYRLELAPSAYWGLWSDALIHRIHGRVLRHIEELSIRD